MTTREISKNGKPYLVFWVICEHCGKSIKYRTGMKNYRCIVCMRAQLRGPDHPSWKGGRNTRKDGYVLINKPEHPLAGANGYVYEHRLVAEQKLGRPLKPTEQVHHLDGNPSNNNPSNIVVCSSSRDHLTTYHRKRGVCPQCLKWKDTFTKGLCRSCYNSFLGKVKRRSEHPERFFDRRGICAFCKRQTEHLVRGLAKELICRTCYVGERQKAQRRKVRPVPYGPKIQ